MYMSSDFARTDTIKEAAPITGEISITSIDVINNYNRLLDQIKDINVAQALKSVEDKQNIEEQELVARTTVCDVPMLSSLRDHIGGLRANQLKEISISQLHNPSAMKATMCTVDSIFYTSPYDVGSLYLNNRIRMYIHNLRQIGSESVEGYSLLGDFENAKDMFVIKVSRSPTDDTLLHELIIGLYGTNKLRQYIPNFAYIYGGFKCSPPLVDPESKKVVTWCLHNENAVNYVLYENITSGSNPSIPLSKYIETCTGKEFVNVYIQLVYALRLALKVIDFTHYDLHYDNVLIRIPNADHSHSNMRKFQIAYETERGVEYITTDNIPTIVDYGFSHIHTDDVLDQYGTVIKSGQHYGRSNLVPFSIYAYRSWIIHDVYKLLMFCMMAALRHNNQSVLTEIIKIFRFFNHTEDPIVAINSQAPVLFAFPLTDLTNNLSINELASHIRRVCDCDFISPSRSNDPILDCERICLTENTILTKIGMDPNGPIGIPDNIIEFYDIAVRLQNENREEEKGKVAQAFAYKESMRLHIDKMHLISRELLDLRRRLKLVDIGDMTIDQILNYNTMMIVRSMYVSVGAIVDKTVELRFLHEIGIAVAQSYQDDNAVRIMDDIMSNFNIEIRPGLEDAKRVLGTNHDHLNRIQNDNITQQSINRDERLKWYWTGRNLFDIVFGRIIITPTPQPADVQYVPPSQPADVQHVTTPQPVGVQYINIPPSSTQYVTTPQPADVQYVTTPQPAGVQYVTTPQPADVQYITPSQPADVRYVTTPQSAGVQYVTAPQGTIAQQADVQYVTITPDTVRRYVTI